MEVVVGVVVEAVPVPVVGIIRVVAVVLVMIVLVVVVPVAVIATMIVSTSFGISVWVRLIVNAVIGVFLARYQELITKVLSATNIL